MSLRHDFMCFFVLIVMSFLPQTACLRTRDQTSHDALAVEMLYAGAVGTEPPTHPEFAAFKMGFELPCINSFKFTDVSISINDSIHHLSTCYDLAD